MAASQTHFVNDGLPIDRADPALEALLVRSESSLRQDIAALQGLLSYSLQEATELVRNPPLVVRPGLEAHQREAAHRQRQAPPPLHPCWADGSFTSLILERPDSLPQALQAVRPGRPRVARLTGVAVLSQSRSSQALGALRSLLRDLDATVRRRAIQALPGGPGNVDLPPALINGMIRQLLDRDARERLAAIERLRGSGCFEALPALRCLLHDSRPEVALAAHCAVASLGGWEDIDSLVLTLLRRTAGEGCPMRRPTLPCELEMTVQALGHSGDIRGLHALRVCQSYWDSDAFLDAWLAGHCSGIPFPDFPD